MEQGIGNGISRYRQIYSILNNADYGAYGTLESFPRENIVKQFNTNVIRLMDGTKAIIPHFRANKSEVIVNISSIDVQMTFALSSLYYGIKFAVEGISESLHYEMKEIGVKVKIVELGIFATDFEGRSFHFQPSRLSIINQLLKL
jgi:short-subunit dehydrogenase